VARGEGATQATGLCVERLDWVASATCRDIGRNGFLFVEPDQVAPLQRELGATGFDAAGATYPHKDGQGRCSFKALIAEHRAEDPALQELARIVRGADFPDLRDLTRESAGLQAISRGFPLVAKDDYETLDRAAFLYDALYASIRDRLSTQT